MNCIRPATAADASRIAEIIITNYRLHFYPFFRNDAFYFGELNVVAMAAEYKDGSPALRNSLVYDDGAVKGVIRVSDGEIEKLFVEPQFQGQGIGTALLEYAVRERGARELWALAYNIRGISFYRRNGFVPTGEERTEDGCVPLLKLQRAAQG